MNKLLVILFDSESQAQQGDQALHELHTAGSLSVSASAIIVKAADGTVSVTKGARDSHAAEGVGPIVGGMIGLLGGTAAALALGPLAMPLGMIAGTTGGGFLSLMHGFVKAGGREEFANEVAGYLLPGKAAVIADVDEHQVLPTDTRMEAVGGRVFRQPRTDSEYLHVEQELASQRDEVKSLREEIESATDADKGRLQDRLRGEMSKLQSKIEQAQRLEEATRRVGEEKARSLEAQAATAQGSWQGVLQQRTKMVHTDYDERIYRLGQARQAAQEALDNRSTG